MLDGVTACHDRVAIHSITQATTATFIDLYVELTFLFFIQSGSKRVVNRDQDLVAEEGDLLVFQAGSTVTMENRPVLDRRYRAIGVSFPDAMVAAVFGGDPQPPNPHRIQHVPVMRRPGDVLPLVTATLYNCDLPRPIRRHRLLEPLIWLRDAGLHLTPRSDLAPVSRVRQVVEQDLCHDWRAGDVAVQLGMSEATMRRWLMREGHSFSRILLNTRLERGLSFLQTTDRSVSDIAFSCGFKTPSHFADAFRRRFDIRPKDIRIAPN